MSDDFDVPVTVFLPVAMYRRLARVAKKHETTVPLLALEVIRRQLASNDARRPKVKRPKVRKPRPTLFTPEIDELIRLRNSQHISDAAIAREVGISQVTVSKRRKALGLPTLFRSPNPGKGER